MPNNRIFYPVHTVAVKEHDGNLNFAADDAVHGVQSMSMNTNFNVLQTNELGTQTIYSNVEGIPDIQLSLSKVLDGRPTPYMMSTQAAVAPTLIARSAVRCTIGAAIFADTNSNSSGTFVTAVALSGAFVDSVSYNFTTDGNFTEDTTFVSNNKIWYKTGVGTPNYGSSGVKNFPPIVFNAFIPLVDVPLAANGVARSQDFVFEATGALTTDLNGAVNHSDVTVMPTEIAGFTISGTNPQVSGQYSAHVSSFTASVSLSREDINELGRRGPYFRSATFPIEVTSELQATASEGDLVSAMQEGIFGSGVGACGAAGTNTKDRTIRVVLCEGLRLYLGTKNRLQSVGYSGGDADGGNVTISYTYTNFNDFTVMHSNDAHFTGVNQAGPSYSWAGRATYLTV